MIDSQAMKHTCNASVESKGFCFYKVTNGIKRHLAVDTPGFSFFTHCTKADVSDEVGLVENSSSEEAIATLGEIERELNQWYGDGDWQCRSARMRFAVAPRNISLIQPAF